MKLELVALVAVFAVAPFPSFAQTVGTPAQPTTISPPPRPTLDPARPRAKPVPDDDSPSDLRGSLVASPSERAQSPPSGASDDDPVTDPLRGPLDQEATPPPLPPSSTTRPGAGPRLPLLPADQPGYAPGLPPAATDDVGASPGIGTAPGSLPATDPDALPEQPLARDDRTPEEIREVQGPAPGFDPDAFPIEVNGLDDRRTDRLYRFEPFVPQGRRIGSFVVLPSVDAGITANSNVLLSSASKSDVIADVQPTLRIVSDWSRHALEFRAFGVVSAYDFEPALDDRAYTLETRGRLDITKYSDLEALASRAITQDSPSNLSTQLAGGSSATRATVTTDTGAATFNQRFNRVSLQLRGSASEVAYSGALNADQNVNTFEEAMRVGYELKPSLGIFAETAINQRQHETAAVTDGISRDSTGERYRVGLGFGGTSAFLRGEISVGYGRQNALRPGLADSEGVLLDANATYVVTRATRVRFTAHTDVTETTLPGSIGAFTRQVGLEVRHDWTPRLSTAVGVSETASAYAGSSLYEREEDATMSVDYSLTRSVTLTGRYQHATFVSTDVSRNYQDDLVRLGVRVAE